MKLKPYLTTVLLTEDSRRHKMRSLRLIIRHQLKRATRLAKPPAFDHIGQHNEDRLFSLPADQPPNREHSLVLPPAPILIGSRSSSSSLADDTSSDPEHLLSGVNQQFRLDSRRLPWPCTRPTSPFSLNSAAALRFPDRPSSAALGTPQRPCPLLRDVMPVQKRSSVAMRVAEREVCGVARYLRWP